VPGGDRSPVGAADPELGQLAEVTASAQGGQERLTRGAVEQGVQRARPPGRLPSVHAVGRGSRTEGAQLARELRDVAGHDGQALALRLAPHGEGVGDVVQAKGRDRGRSTGLVLSCGRCQPGANLAQRGPAVRTDRPVARAYPLGEFESCQSVEAEALQVLV
jgi:hypothetical protein